MNEYFLSELISENIGKTPEGFLVARGCVLARTGWQQYQVRELTNGLKPEEVKALGLDGVAPDKFVNVYRPAEEVLHPDAIASFEGKSIADGHPPLDQFIGPDNVQYLEFGHVENVKERDEPLENGDIALVGDCYIKREPLITDVADDKKRQLSCGYDYLLALDGRGRIVQTSIRGNHVAVVPRGRAGAEARIVDSAPEDLVVREDAGKGSTGNQQQTKEKKPVSWKNRLLGLGIQQLARDEADPEKLAEALEAAHEAPPKKDAKDEKPVVVEEKKEEKKKEEPIPAVAKDRWRADDKGSRTTDIRKRRADDARSRVHDIVERCHDADIDGLEEHLMDFFDEEKGEPQHEEGEVEGEGEGEECAGEPLPAEDGEPKGPVEKAFNPEGRGEDCGRRRAADRSIERVPEVPARRERSSDADEVLAAFRRVAARTNDGEVRQAFNALVDSRRSSRPSRGSYGDFAAASGERERSYRRAADVEPPQDPTIQKLRSTYSDLFAGKKEVK